ncbi:MAG: hypothetical protein LW825_04065 [Candidatus Jidaibacter sp.]|jgi:hypothetical protein|nr:hypothetical protein [Candidatus Jidaibacter sp.]
MKEFIDLGNFPLTGRAFDKSELIAKTILDAQSVAEKKGIEVLIETEELTRILMGICSRETESGFWCKAKL